MHSTGMVSARLSHPSVMAHLAPANGRFRLCTSSIVGFHTRARTIFLRLTLFTDEVRPDVGDAGTYFYHSHVDFQAATTAGPLVVQEASGSPPYTYDEERILFVSELYNKTDSIIVDGLSAPTSGYQW